LPEAVPNTAREAAELANWEEDILGEPEETDKSLAILGMETITEATHAELHT